ncbi:hypothetical protein FIB48_11545 [Lactococcus lactis subsp. lactis]|nr:hypothetical protein FIB48_11545 [Lactococcus lactis subsp. lactis]
MFWYDWAITSLNLDNFNTSTLRKLLTWK